VRICVRDTITALLLLISRSCSQIFRFTEKTDNAQAEAALHSLSFERKRNSAMERELTTRLPIGSADLVAEETSPSIVSLAMPLVGSLFQTAGVVWLLCPMPLHSSLTLPHLIATAIFFLLITMAAHLFAIWSNCRIFREQIDAPFRPLVFATWPSVVWLPLLVLLIRGNSVWMVPIPSLITTSAAFALKRWSLASRNSTITPRDAGAISTLFHIQNPPSLLRVIAPAIITSIAFQAAATELALGNLLTSGSLLAASAVFPIWTYPIKLRPFVLNQDTASSVRSVVPRTFAVFLLITIALLPYSISNNHTPATPKKAAGSLAHGDSYSGVILVLPPKPHHEIVAPPPLTSTQFSSLQNKSVIIPFDGEYWYFRQPDQRPRSDAPIVRGDPTKRNIRSIDTRPLSMEAHQHLVTPIKMGCCRAIHLAIQNADNRPGAIFVEILLKDRASKATQSLGELVIPSSKDRSTSLSRPPVDEVLNFPFPTHNRTRQFDEITVVIKPARERALAGAHIAIQHFKLIP
jgi:hypothetical protein